MVGARWTMDIGLDSSMVEHLTSDAGVSDSIPSPAIYLYPPQTKLSHFYFSVFVHSSHPYYIYNYVNLVSENPCFHYLLPMSNHKSRGKSHTCFGLVNFMNSFVQVHVLY